MAWKENEAERLQGRDTSGGEALRMALMKFCDHHRLEKDGWRQ